MTDNTQTHGGESQDPQKFKRGILEQIAIWILLLRAGELTRDKRRKKGVKPPSTGISGPINHDEVGHPWVWLEVETVHGYAMMDRGQKSRFWYHLEDVLKSFAGWARARWDAEIDLQVQALPYDLNKVNEDLKASVIGVLSGKLRQRHTQSRQRAINEIKRRGDKERRVFVGVKLRDERSLFYRMLAQLMLWMGFSSLLANGNEDVVYREQIQEVLGKFEHNHVDVRLLSGMETAQVIQHCVYRGHKRMPKLSEDGSGVINNPSDLRQLSNSVAYDRHDMMEIIHDGESSFASYMAVAEIPEEFDGLSWLNFGDLYGQPVEVSARLRVKALEASVTENAKSLNRVNSSLEDLVKKAFKSNIDREKGRLLARMAVLLKEKERLEKGEPKVDAGAFLIVSGYSQEKVRENSRHVIAQCQQNKVTLEIDSTKLAELRRQTYPGTRLLYTTYTLNLFCDGMAQAMPHATSLIGNGGDLLGVVRGSDRGPFRYAHRLVLKKKNDQPPGQVFLGPSGRGKSSFMVNCVIADAEAGMAGIYDEGKGDSRILENEDGLLVDIKVMDLSAPEMGGLLNPLYLGDNPKESRDLTLKMLMKSIGSEAQNGWRPLVRRVVADELNEYPDDPDFDRIVHHRLLGADPSDPRYAMKIEIGEAILGMMEAEYAEIIFAKGKRWKDVANEYIRRGQVTFVVYGHLTPPETEKPDNELSEQERLAYLVRDLTNVIYYKFALDPNIPLAVYKDEIQIDKRMGGSVSSGHLSRIGRSKGSHVGLGGQLVDDPPEDFWPNTSTIWFFEFKQPDQAEKAIRRLGYRVKEGSKEYEQLLDLMMGARGSGRNKYDVVVKTYDDEIGLVALNQLYHQGLFVSNIEAVAERHQQRRGAAAAKQLPYALRAETPEAAEEALVRLGVSPDVIGEPNGHQQDLERCMEIVQGLEDDERLVVEDGQLKVLRGTETSVPQLPMSSAGEEVPK